MQLIKLILITACCLCLYSCGTDSSTGNESATEEPHEEDAAIVSLTKEQMTIVGVELGVAEQKNLEQSIKVNGKLEVPAQNKAVVTSLYEGLLQQILVHPGSSVRKGQVIATVTNTELTNLQQSLISVNAQLKLVQLEFSRQTELVAGNAAPLKNLQKAEAELNSLRAQQAALKKQLTVLGISPSSVASGTLSSTLTLTAPISGTISDIHAQIGSKVDATTPVAEIVNNSQLHLDLFVYEKDLMTIKEGQIIHFTLTNNPGKEYDATIFSIGTAFTDASKSVPVHAEVQGDKSGLIEGMNVTAIISIGNRTAMAIPSEAIVTNGGKDYIFIQTSKKEEEHEHSEEGHEAHDEEGHKENGQGTMLSFERIQVVKGVSDLGFTEIQPVTELPEDAKIIVKGAFFVLAKMTNAGGHEH
ncbi:MAG TPA: efflux RND transporter periplasmic adaptor subunit [Flavipsychrobacter sp.]|nr:efflux RND transporter periplasmic adaptor subunit [Flavipsychrobacter sp.]